MILLRALNRWQAAGLHFGASLTVIGLYGLLVFFVWYPQPYGRLEGAWEVVRILAGVDVVLGPLLTAIVFNPAKPGLRRDLALIVAVQLLALAWGVRVTYAQRPLYLAYVPNSVSFAVVAASEIEPGAVPAAVRHAGWGGGPLAVYVNTGKSGLDSAQLLDKSRSSGRRVSAHAEWYEPLAEHWAELRAQGAVDMDRRLRQYPDLKPLLDAFLAKAGGRMQDYVFVTIEGRRQLGFLALRQADGSVAGIITG